MKLFGVQRYIAEKSSDEAFRAKITEYVNIEHIVSIEGYYYKDFSRRGYMLHLSNGRSFYIHDSEYQSLIDLIEANEKEKKDAQKRT